MYVLSYADFCVFACSDHAAAFVEGLVPPQDATVEETVKVTGEMSAQQLMSELATAAERQTELATQLKTRYIGESSILAQKDEEIALLKAQLADARAEVGSVTEHAKKITDKKLCVMAELQHARGELHQFRSNLTWGLRYLEEKKAEHFGHIEKLRVKLEKALRAHEEKLRRLSIEYDEELYPNLMSTIAEHRYVLSTIPLFRTYVYLCSFFILMHPL